MITKKGPGSEHDFQRHQGLLERFKDSRQTPREFITQCLQAGLVSGADALELMPALKSKVSTRSFALADLSDEQHFRQGLYETTLEDSENNPVFVIQFDQKLQSHSEEIQTLLENFTRDMAELVSQYEGNEAIKETDVCSTREEAMDTILDTLPSDSPSH